MDIRNYVSGDAEQQNEYIGMVLAHSIDFATTLIKVIDRWVDDLPDGMSDEISAAIDNFIGLVGEFVDVDAMCDAQERGDVDPSA